MVTQAFPIWATVIPIAIAVAILVVLELGWRIGKAQQRDREKAAGGTGTIDGAIFGLMGLLLAFTFSGAAARFDARRSLVLEESNTIGTAYLRLDLLPADRQAELREDFRQYVDSRLEVYRALPNVERAKANLVKSAQIQSRIWSHAVAATRELNSPAATSLILATLNNMIDITTTRVVATQTHPPTIIFVVLVVMVLAAGLLAGYNMSASSSRNWTHRLVFMALMTLALYLILDLELPRFGLIRIDDFDRLLVDVRNSMK